VDDEVASEVKEVVKVAKAKTPSAPGLVEEEFEGVAPAATEKANVKTQEEGALSVNEQQLLAPVVKAKAAEASELESVVKSEAETKENVESKLEGAQAKASEADNATTELAPDSFDAKNVCYLRDVQDAARLVDVIAALKGLGDAMVAAVTACEELVHKGAEEADSFRQE
jgi:hypothetical protein